MPHENGPAAIYSAKGQHKHPTSILAGLDVPGVAFAMALIVPSLCLTFIGGSLLSEVGDLGRRLALSPHPPSDLPCRDKVLAPACGSFIQQGHLYAAAWMTCLVASAVAVVSGLLYLVRRETPHNALGFLIAALLSLSLSSLFQGGYRNYRVLGSRTFDNTLGLVLFKDEPIPVTYQQWLDTTLDWANAATATGATFIAVASLWTVVNLPKVHAALTPDEREAYARDLAVRLTALRTLLLVGAILLVAGLTDAAAYLAWPTSLLPKEVQPTYQLLTGGVIAFQGTEYSLILIAIFLAPVVVIYRRSAALAALDGTGAASDWLNERGLSFSVPNVIKDALVAAAPLISTPVLGLAVKGLGST